MNSCIDENRMMQELDRLEACLNEQIRLARCGQTSQLEVLCRESDEIVRRLVQDGMGGELFEQRRGRFEQLYGELSLAVGAQLSGTAGELKLARKTKRTLRAYKSGA